MIEICSVTKRFGSFKAIDSIKLVIERSSFFGLLGPNGAGKTTLIRMIMGLTKPTSGEILIKGEVMDRSKHHLKKLIGIMPQHTNLDKELTAEENLIFAAKLFKMRWPHLKERVKDLLEFVELIPSADKLARHLSGGMQRRLMLAKALIHDPEILFLDEPTVGMDLTSRRKMWDILKTMQSSGKTVIMTTHYIEEAENLCQEVALMDLGQLFTRAAPQRLIQDLGPFTVEHYHHQETHYAHFSSKEEAREYSLEIKGPLTLRKTTLEDVFYRFSTRRIEP